MPLLSGTPPAQVNLWTTIKATWQSVEDVNNVLKGSKMIMNGLIRNLNKD